VLTALVAKTLHGGGAGIETNLLNGALFLMSELVQAPDGSFSGMAPPPDDDQLGPHPAERLYEAKDGWIAIAARDDAMAARLLKTLDITEDLPRSEWGRAQIEAIGSRLADLTGDEALKLLDAADVWAERCERDGWAAAKADPRLVACGMIGEGIASGRGTITQIMRAFDLDGSGPSTLAQGLVDTVGGHSRAILRESGFPDDETERLIQSNVVRTTDG
jgi:crotonobetainyl-CoA:carnitine CoA-transferase CaiB-like acyl-CoA transferase